MCNPKLNQNVDFSIISTVLQCWILVCGQMSVDFKASIPRNTIEISPKQCAFSLLNVSDAANSDLLWIRGTAGKAEMHWPVATSLSLKTYGARGKVSKSAGKLEISLSHYTMSYPGSCAEVVLLLHETEVRSHQQVSWNFCTLRKKGWSSLTWRRCGFLVWLADSGSSCKPHRNVFPRPFCLSGCVVFRHFRASTANFHITQIGP